jgi:hypothetical protein
MSGALNRTRLLRLVRRPRRRDLRLHQPALIGDRANVTAAAPRLASPSLP